jgi:preprotein translocase subunit SecE
MSLAIYKSGQGFWTRVCTAIGAGVLVLAGVVWVCRELEVLRTANKIYIQTAVAVGVIAVFGALIYWILNKPSVADFMIATEAEMRKVNWPTWREISGATWIVICGTFLMALLLWVIDLSFTVIFQKIGIIAGGS